MLFATTNDIILCFQSLTLLSGKRTFILLLLYTVTFVTVKTHSFVFTLVYARQPKPQLIGSLDECRAADLIIS